MIEIRLTPAEIIIAGAVASMRQAAAVKHDRRPGHGSTRDQFDYNMIGACGEMAVAKALNVYYNGAIGDLAAADVGSLQVRTTPRDNGRLILHDSDPPDDIYILVTGKNGRYRLAGWLYGRDGQIADYWEDPARNGRNAFFVPRQALRPIAEIVATRSDPAVAPWKMAA